LGELNAGGAQEIVRHFSIFNTLSLSKVFMRYFLGADLGGTKTHMVIADETGHAVGFGESGAGNHESVGFDGMYNTLADGLDSALKSAGLAKSDISGAGFGIAGYDWPSEKPKMIEVINRLGLNTPYEMMNDAIPGLVAGADEGWGVVIISGTGCNARGWDKGHQHEGRVTGYGVLMGEAAGSSELVTRAMQMVGFEWTRRGPKTALSQMFMEAMGVKTLGELLEIYTQGPYHIGAEFAPRVFQVAQQGDPVAVELIHWAGKELGEMANAIIRQLEFENLKFDVVLAGGMFEGGPMLIDSMRETIQRLAPHTRLVRLTIPPVVGAVLVGMEKGNMATSPDMRKTLSESLKDLMHTAH
jgi:N-acetylglucosamine kinase-like BadF-type ATPase